MPHEKNIDENIKDDFPYMLQFDALVNKTQGEMQM